MLCNGIDLHYGYRTQYKHKPTYQYPDLIEEGFQVQLIAWEPREKSTTSTFAHDMPVHLGMLPYLSLWSRS